MSIHGLELARSKRAQSYASKATIQRVVDAARACGLDVNFIEVRRDGAIRLGDADLASANDDESEFDRLVRKGQL